MTGHTGTETRPRLLREAAVGNIVYMTPSEVFQRWGSVYKDKEKREFLEDMARGKTMSGYWGRVYA